MKKQSMVLALVLALGVGAAAQTLAHRWIPRASQVGGRTVCDGFVPVPFGWGDARFQQVIAGSELAAASGVIMEMALLPVPTAPVPVIKGATLANVKISLGATLIKPGAMTTLYSANRGAVNHVVFQGNLKLPDLVPGPTGTVPPLVIKFLKPYIYKATANSNLLLEIENPAANPSLMGYEFATLTSRDAGNVFSGIGQGGTLPASTTPGAYTRFELEGTGLTANPSHALTPGDTFRARVAFLPANHPTLVIFGFRMDKALGAIPLPFDLTPLGAPGNSLLVDPGLAWPIALADKNVKNPGLGPWWTGETLIPIPNQSAVVGALFYCQALAAIPGHNRAGLTTSTACGGLVGGGTNQPQVEALAGWGAGPTGTMWINGANGGKCDYGGLVVRFGGFFQ